MGSGHEKCGCRDRLRTPGPGGPGAPKLQEVVTTLLANDDESSAGGRLAREPGLLGLVGADVLQRHVGGGGDPIGAEVGLEGRGHKHRAVLGREQASGGRPAGLPASGLRPPPWDPPAAPAPHLLLIALQEGDEETRDSAGRGVHLRGGALRSRLRRPREGLRCGSPAWGEGGAGEAVGSPCARTAAPPPRSGT